MVSMILQPQHSRFTLRVYWEDTDAGGIVYHTRYLAFMDRARTEWMRGLGYDQRQLQHAYGIVFVVRSAEIDFLSPAHLDDKLEITVDVQSCKRVSVLFRQVVYRQQQSLATALVRLAALDADKFKPCQIPNPIYTEVKALETML